MKLAAKYGVNKVQALCTHLLEADVSIDNVLELVQLGPSIFGDPTFGIAFLGDHVQEVMKQEAFTRLPKETLARILASDQLGVEEIDLYQGLVRWFEAEGKRQGPASEQFLKDKAELLKLIRFPLMAVSDLAMVTASGSLDPKDLLPLFSYCSIQDEKVRATLPPMTFSTKPRAVTWTWGPAGSQIELSEKNLSAMMKGSSWNQGLVLGSKPLTSGSHYWEVKLTVSQADMIGVCKPDIPLAGASAYSTQTSSIWFAHHQGSTYGPADKLPLSISAKTGDVIGLLLTYSDGGLGSLTYYKNGSKLGTPFTQIPRGVVPAVELYNPGSKVTLNSKAKRPA